MRPAADTGGTRRWMAASAAPAGGIEAGPDGGARFIAPPDGSGTEAGGTGGGRSVNICAETGAAIAKTSMAGKRNARQPGARRRPDPIDTVTP